VVVLSGEPGVGKTALIGEVLGRGRKRGYQALSTRASEFERDLPFAAFADALEGVVGSLAAERRGLVDDVQLALLAAVFPSLGRHLVGVSPQAEPDGRYLVLRALHALLEVLADERSLVLALDDLQWADAASIDLVCRLLYRGLAGQSLLVLASRPGQSEPRLLAAVADAERHGQAMRFELGPLNAAEAKKLLGGEVDPALAEVLYEESGGNPFYLEQLAAASRSVQDTPSEESVLVASGVPRRVSAAIRSELDDLSSSARVLLQGAAVAGDPFEPELAAEAAGLAAHDALGDLDELLQHDFIRGTDSPRRFCFRHPIVRRAVYDAAGAGWCLQAHGRAAVLLETQGAPATARAHHIERSARVGDGASAAILVQAGQELISRSPASAAHWFEVGLHLTPERPENLELRVGLMAQHAMALGLAGQIKAGRKQARRILALAPPEPSELRRRVTLGCVAFETLLGSHADGRRLLLDELARLPDQLDHQAAELKYELASSYYFDANWSAMRRWSKEALAADCQGIVRVGSLAASALAEFNLANLDSAQQSVSEAAQIFDGLTDKKLAARPGVTILLAQAELHTERLADLMHHTERSIVIARASGQRLTTVGVLAAQAHALALMGRVPELTVVAEAATETALLSSSDLLLSMAMGVRAFASLQIGDFHSALRFAEYGARAALGPMSPPSWGVRIVRATALLEMGEPRSCREQLTDPEGKSSLPPIPFLEGHAYGLLIAAEIALGDLTRAEELASRSAESAQQLGTNLPLALAHRAFALVALARGETHAAVTAALQSYEAAQRAGAQVEAARSQTLAGRALAAAGERSAAIATLRAAHATLLTCGALHDSDRTAKELRRLGRAVPRSRGQHGQPNILGLTEREREVIEQVAVGKTNREIAKTLFLSPRTVDRHLARIFEKLNVHSRAAASSTFTRATHHQPP
jgi:DNA-binding CsgD family transcriptional regulator/tetratricopeptide (TPR) repeat protein